MKISNVSKKVLASALSAAMVVAFAPTVAFGDTLQDLVDAINGNKTMTEAEAIAAGAVVSVVEGEGSSELGSTTNVKYYTNLDAGLDALAADKNYTVKLLAAPTLKDSAGTALHGYVIPSAVNKKVTIDLNGFELAGDTAGLYDHDVYYAVTTPASSGLSAWKTAHASDTFYTGAANFEADSASGAYKLKSGGTETALTISEAAAETTYYSKVAKATAHGTAALTYAGSGTLTVKGGTVTAGDVIGTGATKVTPEAIHAAVGATVTLDGLTVSGTADEIDAVKGGTYKLIKGSADLAVSGTVTAAGIDIAANTVKVAASTTLTVDASQTKDNKSAIAIKGNVAFGTVTAAKPAVVTATAAASGDSVADATAEPAVVAADVDAYAIDGTVTGIKEGVTLTAKATATGLPNSGASKTADATAVKALGDAEIAKGAVTLTAASAEGVATGVAEGNVKVTGGTVFISAVGKTDKAEYSKAIANKLEASAGKYVGHYGADAGKLTGGSYSVKPVEGMYTKGTYGLSDDGEFWTVSKIANFASTAGKGMSAKFGDTTADTTTTGTETILAFVNEQLEAAANGEGLKGIALAEGVSVDDFVAKGAAGKVKVGWTSTQYNTKRATDEQKAAYEAIKAYAAKNLALIEDADNGVSIWFNTLTVYYTDAAGNAVTLGEITDLGTVKNGRVDVDNKVVFNAEAKNGNAAPKTTVLRYDAGVVSAMAWDVDEDTKKPVASTLDVSRDGIAGTDGEYWTVSDRVVPTVYAVMSDDAEAIKNAIINGSQETETPAVEKATQSIDVAQKSKTVKLSGAKKTKKAVTFKLGASAETALTIAKKSGSSRITVSGQKVTLKKGTKKGTFTAKVSLKAASSDEFLAAAKTITVKFVVKK